MTFLPFVEKVFSVSLFLTLGTLVFGEKRINERPNIVMIIADDMGSNDVSYRGTNQFSTANIDALGFNGIILDRHYTEAICTPSRAALLTGQNPSKLGMQGYPISAGEDRHLPPDVNTLPSLLKNLGYDTHLVGKWHLGTARRQDMPTGRGFDTYYGYLNGYVGYFSYEVNGTWTQGNTTKILRGFDLKSNFTDAWADRGTYATELFTKKALEVIERKKEDAPMFLLLSHLAVHTGDEEIVEVPDEKSMNEKYAYIQNMERRRYVDALMRLDKSVGLVMEKLQERRILNNTIVVFMSDNGAQIRGLFHNGGSNYPLRGEKFSLHEGGVRNAAVMYSPLMKTRNYVYRDPVHITDWLPTLYSAAGGDTSTLKSLNGVNQWENLSQNKPNQREDFLVNIDESVPYSAVIGYAGKYKLLEGTISSGFFDSYSKEPSTPYVTYNVSEVLKSKTNEAISKISSLEEHLTPETIAAIRKQTSSLRDNAKCKDQEKRSQAQVCSSTCLFDLISDPCETENLAGDPSKKEILENLKTKLKKFWGEMVPQTNKPVDINSDPAKYNGTWCTWKEDKFCVKTPPIKGLSTHLSFTSILDSLLSKIKDRK